MEARILLSHKSGHEPPGQGGGGGGGGETPPAAEYSLIDLGTLPGGSRGYASDVNESGWVVGAAFSADGNRAFVLVPQDIDGDGNSDWYSNASGTGSTNDLMIELTTVSSVLHSGAQAINNTGQVAGWYRTTGDARAFLITPQDMDGDGVLDWNWDADGDGANDLMTDLGSLGGSTSVPWDINDQGQVVGESKDADGIRFPFLWNPDAPGGTQGTMVSLGTIGVLGGNNVATGINESGQIVGHLLFHSEELGYHARAFVLTPQDVDGDGNLDWYTDADADGKNDLMVELGTLDTNYPTSEANAINDSGLVVGEAGSDESPIYGHAVQWQQEGSAWSITDLGGLHKPRFTAVALDVNNHGQVVGYAQKLSAILWGANRLYEPTGDPRAFLYDGQMRALDTLVADMAGFASLEYARAIADAGFIVGYGDVNGNAHGFIAVPSTSTASASSSLLAAASESTAASLNATTSAESPDDSTLVSVATPLPSTTSSISSAESESATAATDESEAVDEALSELDAGPLDDSLLEFLAVALVG